MFLHETYTLHEKKVPKNIGTQISYKLFILFLFLSMSKVYILYYYIVLYVSLLLLNFV